MGLGHKLKRAGEHIGRMAKYGLEEGNLSKEESQMRIAEIRADDSLSDKEKRERIRAIQEMQIAKSAIDLTDME